MSSYIPCNYPYTRPKYQILLDDCNKKDLCDPIRSLIQDWSIDFSYSIYSDLTPNPFHAVGLYSQCFNDMDSVAQRYLPNVSHPPNFHDLDGSKIKLQIPGIKGSTRGDENDYCTDNVYKPNVEAYFIGQGSNVGKYYAILDVEILTTGNEAICRVKNIDNKADEDSPIDLIFVAVLRYLVQPTKSKLTNTFPKPPPFDELD